MQDLEELGLIYAPHASAGRLPTQQGLRLFVDALLDSAISRARNGRASTARCARGGGGRLRRRAGRDDGLLSDLTRGAGVVLTSKIERG